MAKPVKTHGPRRWHRYLGISVSVLVIILCVTGILVQHAEDFGYEESHLSSSWAQRLYGISPNPTTSFQTQNYWVSHSGEYIYIDDQAVEGRYRDLTGAAEVEDGIAIASETHVLLLTEAGEIIESISSDSDLPEAAVGLAANSDNALVVRGQTRYWQPDAEWLEWNEFVGKHPKWSAPSDLVNPHQSAITKHNMSNEISWERMLLDLHSGRVFGRYGIYVMDFAAIGLLVLSCTGLWIWLRHSSVLRR